MRSSIPAGALFGLAVLLAACSGSGSASVAGATRSPAAAETAAPATATAASPAATDGDTKGGGSTAAASVALASNPLGTILVDGAGKVLYAFTPDSATASTCYDKCASNWPPLLSDAAPTLGTGLDAADFTTVTRTDGTKQVAFYGHPLYFFAGDAGAGETKGQGLGGKWYVLGADGKAIK